MKILDYDIRTILYDNIKNEFKDHPDTLIVDELTVCQGDARVDVAVVNGSLHGYEIKSEGDTLARLPNQMELYNKVFDTITIVSGECHIKKITKIIPDWWGIISVIKVDDGSFDLKTLRNSRENPKVDAFSLVQLLWRNEVLSILEENGLDKGYKSKPKYILWERLSQSLPLEKLRFYVRRELKNRRDWRAD